MSKENIYVSPLVDKAYLKYNSRGYSNNKHIIPEDFFQGLVSTSDFKLVKNLHFKKKSFWVKKILK